MNPDQPSREQIEARLTALLLGELPADEAALLRYTMAQDPALQKLHDELQATLALVREAEKNPADPPVEKGAPLKFSAERRQKLLAHFKTPRPRPEPLFWLKRIKMPSAIEVLVVVALLALVAAMLMPSLSKSKSRAMRAQTLSLHRTYGTYGTEDESQPTATTDESKKDSLGVPTPAGSPQPSPLAPPPAAPPVQIVLPSVQPESTQLADNNGGSVQAAFSPTKTRSVVPSASHGYSQTGKFSQNVVGYVNIPQSAAILSIPLASETPPPAAPAPVAQPPAETGAGQLAVNNSDGQRPRTFRHALAEHAENNSFGGGFGGIGGAGGGGGAAVGHDVRRAGANPSSQSVDAPATATFEFDNSGANRSVGGYPANKGGHGFSAGERIDLATGENPPATALPSASALIPAGEFPAAPPVATSTPKSEPAPTITPNGIFTQTWSQDRELFRVSAKPKAQDSGQLASDMPESGGIGGSAGNAFNQNMAPPPEAPKTPLLADTPVVGSVFQSSASSSAIAPAATRAPGNPNHFISSYSYVGSNFATQDQFQTTNAIVVNSGVENTFNPGVSAVEPASPAAPTQQEEMIQPGLIDFEGVELSQVLAIYAKLTGRTLLRSALPPGQVILHNRTPLTKTQAIEELQAVLALNGVSVVNIRDKFVKVVPSDQAGTTGGDIDRSGSTNVLTPGSYVTQVVQLRYVKPTEMAPVIQPFAGLANDDNGTLVLRDTPENIGRMLKIIEQVDVSVPAEYISEVFPIHYAKVDDIASALNGIQLVNQTKIIPNESGGSLLVYATRADMFALKEAIAKLDAPDLPLRKPAPSAPVPQPEILTSSNAFSTFAMNVSDVSFKLAEASLQQGRMPDTASIRSEEFINAFDYRDPEAAPGQPMAFTAERARYPFAQNRELLRFSIKAAAAGRQAGRALNLVLLLDTSGSMERADRVQIIREALRVLVSQLQPNDTVSVVSFARTARLWADGISGDKAGETLDKVGGITPEGGTNLEEAMRLAYETARRHYLPNGINRVVLLTDGAANLGNVSPDALQQKVEAQRTQGIALDCFGIGWEDYNDDLLEQLSSHGDGRYAFLNSPEDAAKDFGTKLAGALQVAAQDLKVQVEFNPARVIAYRQIGYAKHQLTKEQFRDNTVAAGEIAALEAGNALYTIETNPNGDGPIATVHVRYRIPGTQDYREHSWDVPYTGNAPALDQSSPAMRLAATASAFSEWLAASPYAQEVTPDELLKDLGGVPEVYGADDRPKQLETMIREAKSLEGK